MEKQVSPLLPTVSKTVAYRKNPASHRYHMRLPVWRTLALLLVLINTYAIPRCGLYPLFNTQLATRNSQYRQAANPTDSIPQQREFAPAGPKRFTAVITWVNGSDPLHQQMRSIYAREAPHVNMVNRFRDLGELRYTVRSLQKFASWIKEILILTSDYRNVEYGSDRGQVPIWFAEVSSESEPVPPVRVIHHDEFFANAQGSLPTFNSLAIESQLGNLPGLDEDIMLYFNDDITVGQALQSSDFYSPESGFAFAIQSDLQVSAFDRPPRIESSQGEWPALDWSNYLLSQRFGKRRRGYVAHSVKAFATPLLQELASDFPSAFRQTSHHRFRGIGHDVHTPFMAVHYVLEMHRESVLKYFVNNVLDENGDGVVDDQEVEALQKLSWDADLVNGNGIPVRENRRTWDSRNGYPHMTVQPEAGNAWTYTDGTPPSLRKCSFSLNVCLPSVRSAQAILRHIGREHIACGDCLLNTMARASGDAGIDSYLVQNTKRNVSSNPLAEVSKYKYSLTSLSLSFLKLENDDCATWRSMELLAENPTAIICLNDDIGRPGAVNGIKSMLEVFFARLGLKNDGAAIKEFDACAPRSRPRRPILSDFS
ncbi:uncharacterized protein SPPG_07642 [Spizellomyces punctatus DAOM BR117]|uniref:EF-hand domain-containing protein n=1 Tax=Spizellomyces punctatus (strain DAOM BR117) TaxID=645134 RepID=A0A0L0H6W6_SPIPD|nr:uncharacterized protein SPPG_07642 [Spizellomyces punctatus DAOM BR117]KNC97255.1 hypothetical protein SPPG_07642 [Spizellomyces punctatus DAOM BR117]|eukprot:XP_016605295.1 hypothetical protein SPPG_07642 [Spizellomyces punctatus DAOM BR117]